MVFGLIQNEDDKEILLPVADAQYWQYQLNRLFLKMFLKKSTKLLHGFIWISY